MPQSSSPPSHASSVIRAVHMRSTRKTKIGDQVLEPYAKAARWIPLSINPFANITRIIYAGLTQRDDSEDEEYTEEELRMHEDLMSLVPTFKNIVSQFDEDPDSLEAFITMLSAAANASRQEDTATLKYCVLDYMLFDPSVDFHDPPIPRSQLKSMRGFSHPDTAAMLCPIKMTEEFLNDNINFRTNVNDGQLEIRASDWPWFMYDNSEPFEPEEEDKGLCRGYLLVRTFRHIFTGPSSALSGTRTGTKPSKAHIHGLTKVTGRTIAYAAVQTRWALCATEKWTRFDSHFDSEAFYNNIVDVFESDPDDPWVRETLAWWNKQVPGLAAKPKKRKRTGETDPSSGDDVAVSNILTQRAARRKQEHEDEEVGHKTQPHPTPARLERKSARSSIAAMSQSASSGSGEHSGYRRTLPSTKARPGATADEEQPPSGEAVRETSSSDSSPSDDPPDSPPPRIQGARRGRRLTRKT